MKRTASLFLAIACSATPASAVDLAFSTEIEHSASWLAWANCGDYPGLSSSPEHVHMAWHGTLSFDPPPLEGWFTTSSFELVSDRTSGDEFRAYVSGFYAPGGHVTLFVDFMGSSQYADAVLMLPIAAPVPEPAPLAIVGLGLLALGLRRKLLP